MTLSRCSSYLSEEVMAGFAWQPTRGRSTSATSTAWSRLQARELRRLKALRLNTGLDLDHLAQEVRDWGSGQLFALQSQTVRLIEHLLKLQYCAQSSHAESG